MTKFENIDYGKSTPLRPEHFSLENGEKCRLPFSSNEYEKRLADLRAILDENELDSAIISNIFSPRWPDYIEQRSG